MIWIIIAIVVIVIIVNSNKKKKQQQGQRPPQTGAAKPASKAAATAAAKPAGKSAPTKPGAPPKAGDKLDQAAFARAFAHMSGDAPQGGPSKAPAPEAPKSAPAAATSSAPASGAAPKAEPAKSSAPPKAGDKLDQAAFARAFAHMSGDASQGGPSKAPAPEAPKSAPAAPPKPEGSKAAGDVAVQKRFQANILGYYDSLWNKETGSLYTELASMPIHHFAVQVKEDRLVESVWLEGDEIPLVSETEFSKLCAGDESMKVIPLADQQAMDRLYGMIRDYLLRLGTVELRDDCFYPLRPGQAPGSQGTPTGAGAAPAGKAAKGFSDSDKEAKLRAQIQAMMEKQKKDNPPKK